MDANRQKPDPAVWQDIPAALGLLTRLPVPVDPALAMARGAAAAWAWPLAGLSVAVLAGLAGTSALALGLTPPLAAGLILATQVIVTGAMHEDGLADSADGLWGGWTVARRLEIMKDSRTGVYGVTALVLGFLLRWSALSDLAASGPVWAPLIATAMLSRVPMVALMVWLPHARSTGLSRSVGRPSGRTLALSAALALTGAALVLGGPAVTVAVVMALTTFLWGLMAQARVKGQTGDILGAAQQLCEVAGLVTLVALAA